MQLNGFVELTLDLSPETLGHLVTGAYKASKGARVGLALNGVSAEAIDRRLDPLVLEERCAAGGVWYLEGSVVTEDLLDLAAEATFVIAASDALSAALDARGIAHMRVEEGLDFLAAGAAPRRKAVPAPVRQSAQRGTFATV